jgi:histidyl-tRNA synthetase
MFLFFKGGITMLTTRPRGTNDILPGEIEKWHYLENEMRRLCREYGYSEIRTPIFEHTELFLRGVGDTTDIVEKEMYTFIDRGKRSITLRPENTAPVVRAYLENKLYALPQPVKLFYIGPMFRYDRPQAGRFRQFHQFGVEVFGSQDPAVDAEVISMSMDFYHRLGLRNLELHVNSVGCPQCRPVLLQQLRAYFRPHLKDLCNNCRERFEKNPLRILDCKEPHCREIGKNAPTTIDCLCSACSEHFSAVKENLELMGIPYQEDRLLVRGLDYYTHTAFEIMAPDIGAQSSIGGGGRYNGLVEVCGGPPIPGIGFALGIERIILAMEQQHLPIGQPGGIDVFVVTAGQVAAGEAIRQLQKIRAAGISADKDYMSRSLKAQMKFAGKVGAKYAVIIGEDEIKQGVVAVRNMSLGEQKSIALEQLVIYLKEQVTGSN